MAHYLAGQSPAPSTVGNLSRRAMLRGSAIARRRRSPAAASSPPAAARTIPGTRAAVAPAERPSPSGRNYSDPVPKKAGMDAAFDGVPEQVRQDREDQHGRPQHVPGEHQPLPAGQPGRRVLLVRRLPDAVLRRDRVWPTTSPTCGRSLVRGFTDALKKASPPARTASSTSCRSTTTRGRSSTARALCAVQGLRSRPRRCDELKTLSAKMKTDGLAPIAFADKDGWPAMGTFDYHQHAPQRLRLPRQPDGAARSLDRPEGQGRLRHLARPAPVPPGRLATAAPGRRRRNARRNKEAGMYLLGMFVGGSSSSRRRPRRPRLLRVPGDRPGHTAGRGRGADRRLHGLEEAQERGRRQGPAEVPGTAGGRRRSTSRATRATSPPTTRPTPAATTRCRRRPSS